MSHENVETVRRAIAAFNEDLAAGEVGRQLGDYIDEDVSWRAAEQPGTLRGRSQALESLRDWLSAMEQLEFVPEEFIDAGEAVIVRVTSIVRGRGSGAEVRQEFAILWRLANGKVTEYREYPGVAEALAAAGGSTAG